MSEYSSRGYKNLEKLCSCNTSDFDVDIHSKELKFSSPIRVDVKDDAPSSWATVDTIDRQAGDGPSLWQSIDQRDQKLHNHKMISLG
ncbi:hypothetical protein HAX54_015404, partial [Datura stramonium]|nr:hypothetical protein [Datura stramonium]